MVEDYTAHIVAARESFLAQAPAPLLAGQEDAQPAPNPPSPAEEARYTLLSADDVLSAPPMQWTLKGILPRRGVGQAYGASMSGKSFLLLSMAAHIAEGKDWYGFRVHQTPVTYVALEGEEGFRQRIRALIQWRGRPLSPELRFVMQPFGVNTAADVAALAACIPKGALVIIDTQNASCPLVDENSAKDVGGIIDGAKRLARIIEGFVLLVAHTGKDTGRGPRGSSAQIPAWDTCIEVARHGQHREWITRKVKDGQDGQRFAFRLAVIDLGEDEDGDKMTSCVALPDDVPVQEEKPLTDNQRYALESLRTAIEKEGGDGIHVDAWRPHFYGRHTGDNEKTKATAFRRGRNELVSLNVISVKDYIYSINSEDDRRHLDDITATCRHAKTTTVGDTTRHPSLEGVVCRPVCRPACLHAEGGQSYA